MGRMYPSRTLEAVAEPLGGEAVQRIRVVKSQYW